MPIVSMPRDRKRVFMRLWDRAEVVGVADKPRSPVVAFSPAMFPVQRAQHALFDRAQYVDVRRRQCGPIRAPGSIRKRESARSTIHRNAERWSCGRLSPRRQVEDRRRRRWKLRTCDDVSSQRDRASNETLESISSDPSQTRIGLTPLLSRVQVRDLRAASTVATVHTPPFDRVGGGRFGFRLSGDQGACELARIGFYALCAPPIRPRAERYQALRSRVDAARAA